MERAVTEKRIQAWRAADFIVRQRGDRVNAPLEDYHPQMTQITQIEQT